MKQDKPNLYEIDPMEDTEEFTPESAQIWRNLSSFAARCMGAGVLGPYTQVIDALREALEEELDIDQDLARAECRIQVACEWIAHGAKPLLWWARENIGIFDFAEDSTQYFPGGPLYQGPPAVCLQRWGFWQTRFEELGKLPGLRVDSEGGARSVRDHEHDREAHSQHAMIIIALRFILYVSQWEQKRIRSRFCSPVYASDLRRFGVLHLSKLVHYQSISDGCCTQKRQRRQCSELLITICSIYKAETTKHVTTGDKILGPKL